MSKNADQWFSVSTPVVTRAQVARHIMSHSGFNKREQEFVDRTLPVIERPLDANDDRLLDELCQGFAASYAAYTGKMKSETDDDDVRVHVWTQYMDSLILYINSMDVVAGGPPTKGPHIRALFVY